MAKTEIQWADYTFNPWIGCRKVAPECANCYAETLDRNRYSKTLAPGTKANPVSHWGSGLRHRTKTWGDPLKWNRAIDRQRKEMDRTVAAGAANGVRVTYEPLQRPRVFCASLADWLDDENVPIEWFTNLLELIHATPNLDWLMLTKRPQNWQQRTDDAFQFAMKHGADHGRQMDFTDWIGGWTHAHIAPANVWIGVSAGADQAAALDIPAQLHFLSCEPMLRPMDTTHAMRFRWVIFGGDSGRFARTCSVDWIREGLAFCRIHGIAPFVKQLGSKSLEDGLYNKFADSHGGDMDEWPEDLKVREFPTVK